MRMKKIIIVVDEYDTVVRMTVVYPGKQELQTDHLIVYEGDRLELIRIHD